MKEKKKKLLKSILIITYGRNEELYSTLIDISKYKNDDLEVLILDNNLINDREKKIREIFQNTKIKLKYYHDGNNYGVALGRNYIIKKASGQILITLDDDIEIENIDFLIKRVSFYFKTDKTLGCLAFNIKNYYTRKSLRHEIPHGNKKLDFNKNLETYYFIGAGHAIKKEVYEKCGIYPDDLGKYGGEESDLSFRIIQNYKILYTSEIEIYHKVSPKGRLSKDDENYLRYRNKNIVIKKYLPKRYFYINYTIWTLYYVITRKIKIRNIFEVIEELKRIKNNPLNKEGIKYLRKVKARLYY